MIIYKAAIVRAQRVQLGKTMSKKKGLILWQQGVTHSALNSSIATKYQQKGVL